MTDVFTCFNKTSQGCNDKAKGNEKRWSPNTSIYQIFSRTYGQIPKGISLYIVCRILDSLIVDNLADIFYDKQNIPSDFTWINYMLCWINYMLLQVYIFSKKKFFVTVQFKSKYQWRITKNAFSSVAPNCSLMKANL